MEMSVVLVAGSQLVTAKSRNFQRWENKLIMTINQIVTKSSNFSNRGFQLVVPILEIGATSIENKNSS